MWKIGDKTVRVPLIQGGMGVGISLGRLAGTVAAQGGVGIISTAQIGFREMDFDRDPGTATLRAVRNEMARARSSAIISWWPSGTMRPMCRLRLPPVRI